MSSMKDKDILIIDDMADVRVLAKKILEGDGARVSDVDGVDAGLAVAKKQAPHLIVLDLEMPNKTGFDFLVHQKNDPTIKDIPVIILSGKKDKVSVNKAIGLGAVDYILKPFRATLILQKVRKALRLNSFLSKKFNANEYPQATFTLSAEITQISEGGCLVETAIRLGTSSKIEISGDCLEKFGVQDVMMRVSPRHGKYASPGRYANEINFVGMNEERAKKVRALLKGGR